MKTLFGMKKKRSCVFLQTLGAIFVQIFKDFRQIKFWESSCTLASYTRASEIMSRGSKWGRETIG